MNLDKIKSKYDKNGHLCFDSGGISIYKYTYDEKGRETSMTSLGTDGNPILNKEKYCKYTLNYDNRGNLIMKKYFDEKGKPCLTGFFASIRKYDEKNHLIQIDYFDTKMKPINTEDGYSKIVYTYTDNYYSRTSKYYNINGKLVKEQTE